MTNPLASHTNGGSMHLSTPVRRECFWKYKMKHVPLVIAVMLGRGDFVPPQLQENTHDTQ